MGINDKLKSTEAFLALLNLAVGRRLRIDEYISFNGNFDRHFTSHSFFEMTLGSVSYRFSGAMIIIDGVDQNDGTQKTPGGELLYCPEATYEISIDRAGCFPTHGGEVEITEEYPGGVLRRTIIKGLLGQQPEGNKK